jgi:pyruvate,water dikinase
MTQIAWFDEIGEEDLALCAGGKGASLCRMSRYGMPVPEGFIVCSQMFTQFMDECGLWEDVYRLLDGIDFSDNNSLEAVATEIRAKIEAADMPMEMQREIAEYYRKLGDNAAVAVRSSGTAEDLDDASFAGQQETFLYVIGTEDVVRYIQMCWASLYNGRAIFYRNAKGFDERSISIAVVVQRMVNSEKAGVLFCANPIDKDLNTVVIEAAWGLGEGVVQGIVTPDNFWIDKTTYEVKNEYISEKEIMVVRMSEAGGVTEIEVSEDLREAPVLSDEEQRRLVDMALKVEAYYKKPQDIEWAIENGQCYLLQSRPITTL